MWTFEMGRCITCSEVNTCTDRKEILKVISPLVNRVNEDETPESPQGIIVVVCKKQQ